MLPAAALAGTKVGDGVEVGLVPFVGVVPLTITLISIAPQ